MSIEDRFFKAISKDITQVPIQFLSERGHGKSTALKTIVNRCMQDNPNIQWKCFDPSQTWYHNSPLRYRQLVTMEKIRGNQIKNVGNCVYEIGSLTEQERRAFVGTIIAQDYKRAYEMRIKDSVEFASLPWTVYIIEESNVIFGSYSFRQKDYISPILMDFVSVGRNYKLSAFLVATAEDGEMSPSLRRRSRRIYGRLVAEGDISRVRKKSKQMAELLEKDIQRFHFVYWADEFIGPVKVPDEVKSTPLDYMPVDEVKVSTFDGGWWLKAVVGFLFPIVVVLLFLAYFNII